MWSQFNTPQVARELQVRLNIERISTQNLQRKFDDISNTPCNGDNNSTSPLRKRHRTHANSEDDSDSNEPSVEEAETDEVKGLGRRFVILHGPWLRRKELIFEVGLDDEYDEKKRFTDTNTMVQGQLHEIRDLLPEKYHGDAFTKKWLSKSVSNLYILCVYLLIILLVCGGNGLTTIQHCDSPQEACCYHL